jgi:UDP-N-acetyl-D-galactosamine dehydrogenase
MIKEGIIVKGADLLMLGITFKENCPDVRNTKIVDVIKSLKEYGVNITIFDPWANPEEVFQEYQIKTSQEKPSHKFDAIILGVAHTEFFNLNLNVYCKQHTVIYDVKFVLNKNEITSGL